MNNESFNKYIERAIKENWERIALSDFDGVSYHYKDIARKIAKIHLLLESAGIEKGDKVAICGKNSAHWAVAFFAAITYGAVPVPILHEFKADNIHHIVNHSEAKLLFVGDGVWENLNGSLMKNLRGIFLLNDFSLLQSESERLINTRNRLNEYFGRKYPSRFTPEAVSYYEDSPEELAVINYTSGSTGFSKGVMLPYRSLWSNVEFCLEHLPFLKAGDGIVCMLPMAHMYGMVIEMIHPFAKGCHLHFLTRVPSPKIIMDAFAAVKPKLIIAVPLIIEKIIKTKVFPLLDKPLMKLMLKVPFLDNQLLTKINDRLSETFGGNLVQMIIGGAALNREVELFLRRIGFPLTVGYGMTECGPLISYAPWDETRIGSCGRIVDRMEGRVDSPDPAHIVGELQVKGANTMLGYYKNDEATQAIFTPDGWMKTGDLCTIDEDGFVYLRGRNKNMILGPSGQNIYPEEIEDRLNNMPYVCESLIVEQEGKLVALVYPDIENAQRSNLAGHALEAQMEEDIAALNKELPAYSQISRLKIYYEEFEKTPKRSIKRYLYQNN
ncbi:AMP-binding protein [Barnesiella viscericola]|mgnify:FL=1|uniref:AMP-binding protein n=1 Tax=Barnesiella viscericola TaxID=397865 RepID=UPI0024B72262|nr:AMP-binding protein [Barnesiella viscericola]